MEKINVRALKGAPLSIVIVLMLQRRSVSHQQLMAETGYSDRTVTQALNYLTDNQIVTRAGHSGFQLTGENYQLPLYWDEKTEPADPSPALFIEDPQGNIAEPQKFSGKNYDSEIEKITTLENRIGELEKQIAEMSRIFYDLKSQLNPEKAPEVVNSTTEIVNSAPLINQSINTDTDKEIKQDCLIDSELKQICDDYCRRNRDGIDYTADELAELQGLQPDPDVLEFVLPRAGDFETAKKWCGWDVRKVKYNLLKRFGVTMPALQRITDDPEISPWLIDHHYWQWYLEGQRNQTLGFVVYKLDKKVDRMKAESADPLQFRYL